mgnify:CR=1 FL=1|tara:strand:- start:192 stop:395 length:204 start_codon:yes stop_codon:yes gene_type:complete
MIKKILLWVCLNSISTGVIAYLIEQNWKSVMLFTMAQATVTLTIYSPFEYYSNLKQQEQTNIMENNV